MLPFKSCHLVFINSNSPSSVYITSPVAAVSFVTSRRRWSRFRGRQSRPRRTRSPSAASLVVPTITSTYSSKSAIAKLRNARETKMADVDSNIQHRQVTLKNHCT